MSNTENLLVQLWPGVVVPVLLLLVAFGRKVVKPLAVSFAAVVLMGGLDWITGFDVAAAPLIPSVAHTTASMICGAWLWSSWSAWGRSKKAQDRDRFRRQPIDK